MKAVREYMIMVSCILYKHTIVTHLGKEASEWVEAGESGGPVPTPLVFSWVMTASLWPSVSGGGPPKPPAATGPCTMEGGGQKEYYLGVVITWDPTCG